MSGLTPDVLRSLYESPGPEGDPPPLQDLCRINWSAIKHAHGPATDVPPLLRALVSPVEGHREFALKLLCETIWHQGDVYEATPTVVPFLYRLLQADGLHEKDNVALLLLTIADGNPPVTLRCQGESKQAQEWRQILTEAGIDCDAKMAHEQNYMAELRQEIVKHFDLLYPYLRHSEPEIRRLVAVAVGRFPEIVKRLRPDLIAALNEESDEYARDALQRVIEAASA